MFGLTWGMSSLALLLVGTVTPSAGAAVQTVAIAGANVISTVVRFVAMRRWIFNDSNPTGVAATGLVAAASVAVAVPQPASEDRRTA